MYTFTGYNVCNGHLHVRKFTDCDHHLGLMIRSLRSFFGLYSPHESLINFSSIHESNFLSFYRYHAALTSYLKFKNALFTGYILCESAILCLQLHHCSVLPL